MDQQEEDVICIADNDNNQEIDDDILLQIARELTTIEERERTRTTNQVIYPNNSSFSDDTCHIIETCSVQENLCQSNKIQSPVKLDEIQRCHRCRENITFSELELHLSKRHNVSNPNYEINSLRKVPKTFFDVVISCHLCDEKFGTVFHLEKHVMLNHNICRICGFQVNPSPYHQQDGTLSFREDSKHIQFHENTFCKLYQCQICYQEFPYRALIENHHKFEHPEPSKYDIKTFNRLRETNCPYCHYSTESIQLMLYHIYLHRPSKCTSCDEFYLPHAWNIMDCKSTSCTRCVPLTMMVRKNYKMKFYDEIQSNLTSKLMKKQVIQPRGKTLKRKIENVPMPLKNLPCLFCDLFLEDGIALHNHTVRVHTQCPICGEEFDTVKQSKEHRKKHIYLICVLCDCVHTCEEDMTSHYKTFHTSSTDILYSILGSIDLIRIKKNKQCPYCFDDMIRNEILDHIEINHNVFTCVKCSNFKRAEDNNCIHCEKGVCNYGKMLESVETRVSQDKEVTNNSIVIDDNQQKELEKMKAGKRNLLAVQEDMPLTSSSKGENLQIEDESPHGNTNSTSFNSEKNSPHNVNSSEKHSKQCTIKSSMTFKSISKTKVNHRKVKINYSFPGKTLSIFFNIPCLYCDAILKNAIDLHVHMLNVHKKCGCCGEEFVTSNELITHYKDVNPIYKCNDCDSHQNSLALIAQHIATQHSETKVFHCQKISRSIIISLYKCKKQCPYCLNILHNEDLVVHLINKHDVEKCAKCTNLQHGNINKLCRKCKVLYAGNNNDNAVMLFQESLSYSSQQEKNDDVCTSNKLNIHRAKESYTEKFATNDYNRDIGEPQRKQQKFYNKSGENKMNSTKKSIEDKASFYNKIKNSKYPAVIVIKMLTNFPCLFCDLILLDGVRLHEHILYVHQQCATCYKQFDTIDNLIYHQSTEHYESICKLCNQLCNSIQLLREHLSKFHSITSEVDNIYEKLTLSIDFIKIGRNEQCPYCLDSVECNSLEYHLQKHEIVRCKNCLMLRYRHCGICVSESD